MRETVRNVLKLFIVGFLLVNFIIPGPGVFYISLRTHYKFNYLVRKFERLTKKNVTHRLGFYSLHWNVVGLCNPITRQIVIDPEAWGDYSFYHQEMLVFHELGHCVLKRFHTKKLLPDDCPYSIMYPNMFSKKCYKKHRDHYYKELFGNE